MTCRTSTLFLNLIDVDLSSRKRLLNPYIQTPVQEHVAEFNEEFEDTQADFQQLDDKMARVSQVATRVGDRLQVPL